MGPKYKCPYYREALGDLTTKDEKAIEDGGGDWSDVGKSQGMPPATFWKRRKGAWSFLKESAWPTPWF